MPQIVRAYYKKEDLCGIKLFDQNLSNSFLRLDIETKMIDLGKNEFLKSEIVIFHYVPSLYAHCHNAFTSFWNKVQNEKVFTLLHGIYPNHVVDYLSDTQNPYLQKQIEILCKKSTVLVSLSESTYSNLMSWSPKMSASSHNLLYHPGVKSNDSLINKLSKTPHGYCFLGGIIRPKKDFRMNQINKLIQDCKKNSINIWLHASNLSSSEVKPEILNNVWKFTYGQISTNDWIETLFNASWVLCPYHTKLQTVSGIIAESISLGTKILCTDFPYAFEMFQKYPQLVFIDNDLSKWTNFLKTKNQIKVKVDYPDWDNFVADLINLIKISV